jgi:hypothetical protein
MKIKYLSLLVSSSLLMMSQPSLSAENESDIAALKAELKNTLKEYEQRIAELEKQLSEKNSAKAVAQGEQTEDQMGIAPVIKREAGNTEELPKSPAIMVVLDAKAARISNDPSTYKIQGFVPNTGEFGLPERGLSLGETELSIAGEIDKYWRGDTRITFVEEAGGIGAVAVESAYLSSQSLPNGLKFSVGRYLSGIGYQNQIHPHDWDFVDASLVYRSYFGYRLSNDGAQLRWRPNEGPFELGAEIAKGAGFPGSKVSHNGASIQTLFARGYLSPTVSDKVEFGLSYLKARPKERAFVSADVTGADNTNTFNGVSNTWVAHFLYKWAPEGKPEQRNFKVQAEYLHRNEHGELACNGSASSLCATTRVGNFQQRSSGYYAQAVYQWMPRWRVGARYEQLDSGRTSLPSGISTNEVPILASFKPNKTSAMVDFTASKNSRFRFQLATESARGNGIRENQAVLQYIVMFGASDGFEF